MYTPCAAEGFAGTTLPMPGPVPAVVHVPGRARPKRSALAHLCGRPTRKRASADARSIAPTSSAVGFPEILL